MMLTNRLRAPAGSNLAELCNMPSTRLPNLETERSSSTTPMERETTSHSNPRQLSGAVFETLISPIQREWPQVARETLEATPGRLRPNVCSLIFRSDRPHRQRCCCKHQLNEVPGVATAQEPASWADSRSVPWRDQLERSSDDLNTSLRPRHREAGAVEASPAGPLAFAAASA